MGQTHRLQLSSDGSLPASQVLQEAMYEAHESIFGGHNATQKTYLKILTFYYWPKMFQEIEKHKNFCLQCQQRKNQSKRKHHWRLYQFQTDQISEFMLTY
jgi:hypothetical protein